MPKVSVIIPAYNAEKCVGSIISNVINQTFTDWELIVVNDGSKDKTPLICDEYAEKDYRIKVIHKSNGGVSAARNTGIEAASGMYIVFVDADDHIAPQYLEALITSIGTADICVFPMQAVVTQREIPLQTGYKQFKSSYYTLEEGYPQLSDRGMLHPPVCKIFSREKILQNGLKFDPSIAMGEDLLFNLSYLDLCETMVIGEDPIYYYIKGNSVLSRTIRKDYADLQIRFYQEREDFCKRHDIHYSLKGKRLEILFDAYSSIVRAKNLSYSDKKEALNRVRKSSLAKSFIKEYQSKRFKEWIFKYLLKFPFEYLLFVKYF